MDNTGSVISEVGVARSVHESREEGMSGLGNRAEEESAIVGEKDCDDGEASEKKAGDEDSVAEGEKRDEIGEQGGETPQEDAADGMSEGNLMIVEEEEEDEIDLSQELKNMNKGLIVSRVDELFADLLKDDSEKIDDEVEVEDVERLLEEIDREAEELGAQHEDGDAASVNDEDSIDKIECHDGKHPDGETTMVTESVIDEQKDRTNDEETDATKAKEDECQEKAEERKEDIEELKADESSGISTGSADDVLKNSKEAEALMNIPTEVATTTGAVEEEDAIDKIDDITRQQLDGDITMENESVNDEQEADESSGIANGEVDDAQKDDTIEKESKEDETPLIDMPDEVAKKTDEVEEEAVIDEQREDEGGAASGAADIVQKKDTVEDAIDKIDDHEGKLPDEAITMATESVNEIAMDEQKADELVGTVNGNADDVMKDLENENKEDEPLMDMPVEATKKTDAVVEEKEMANDETDATKAMKEDDCQEKTEERKEAIDEDKMDESGVIANGESNNVQKGQSDENLGEDNTEAEAWLMDMPNEAAKTAVAVEGVKDMANDEADTTKAKKKDDCQEKAEERKQPKRAAKRLSGGEKKEGKGWIMSCICGDKDDNGEPMIACDLCKRRWEHVDCVFPFSKQAPEGEYFCHVCRPRPTLLTPEEARAYQDELKKTKEQQSASANEKLVKSAKGKDKEDTQNTPDTSRTRPYPLRNNASSSTAQKENNSTEESERTKRFKRKTDNTEAVKTDAKSQTPSRGKNKESKAKQDTTVINKRRSEAPNKKSTKDVEGTKKDEKKRGENKTSEKDDAATKRKKTDDQNKNDAMDDNETNDMNELTNVSDIEDEEDEFMDNDEGEIGSEGELDDDQYEFDYVDEDEMEDEEELEMDEEYEGEEEDDETTFTWTKVKGMTPSDIELLGGTASLMRAADIFERRLADGFTDEDKMGASDPVEDEPCSSTQPTTKRGRLSDPSPQQPKDQTPSTSKTSGNKTLPSVQPSKDSQEPRTPCVPESDEVQPLSASGKPLRRCRAQPISYKPPPSPPLSTVGVPLNEKTVSGSATQSVRADRSSSRTSTSARPRVLIKPTRSKEHPGPGGSRSSKRPRNAAQAATDDDDIQFVEQPKKTNAQNDNQQPESSVQPTTSSVQNQPKRQSETGVNSKSEKSGLSGKNDAQIVNKPTPEKVQTAQKSDQQLNSSPTKPSTPAENQRKRQLPESAEIISVAPQAVNNDFILPPVGAICSRMKVIVPPFTPSAPSIRPPLDVGLPRCTPVSAGNNLRIEMITQSIDEYSYAGKISGAIFFTPDQSWPEETTRIGLCYYFWTSNTGKWARSEFVTAKAEKGKETKVKFVVDVADLTQYCVLENGQYAMKSTSMIYVEKFSVVAIAGSQEGLKRSEEAFIDFDKSNRIDIKRIKLEGSSDEVDGSGAVEQNKSGGETAAAAAPARAASPECIDLD